MLLRKKAPPPCVTKEEHELLLGEVRRLAPLIRSIDRDDSWDDWGETQVRSDATRTGVSMALDALEDVRRGLFSLDEIIPRLEAECR